MFTETITLEMEQNLSVKFINLVEKYRSVLWLDYITIRAQGEQHG